MFTGEKIQFDEGGDSLKPMCRLPCSVLILLVTSFLCCHAVANSESDAVYFVAATPPQNNSPISYPAALYAIGAEKTLLLVRQFFTSEQYFRDLGDDLHGKLYVAGQNGVFIVHQDDPTREDFVPYDNFDDFPCWGVARGDTTPSAMQYCFTDKPMKVLGDAAPGKSRVSQGDWAVFKFLQYGGENGGPFQMQPPLAEIAGVNLVMPYSFQPEVVLARLPSEFNAKPELRHLVWILGSTDRYLIVWVLPRYMVGGNVDASNARHTEPLQVLVLYRLTNRWRTVELPTTVTSPTRAPIRIFGDWLVTTVMHWRAKPRESGGTVVEHGRPPLPNPELPDPASEFFNRYSHLSVPGKLVFQNLTDDRKLTLDTGQEDSEVIAIRPGGEILYRVSDSIYSAKTEGDQITRSTLIVKDVDVPQIHWAFWGPSLLPNPLAGNSWRPN